MIRTIGLACIVILIVISISLLRGKKEMSFILPKINGSLDVAATRRLFTDGIADVGSKSTNAQLKTAAGDEEFSISHTAAHLFGELLYAHDGITGISTCDETFAYGCYHGFFGRAIAHMGVAAIPEFDKACVASFGELGLGCPHGIGHGLGEYFGSERLDEQLVACGTLSWKGPLLGCTGGVFMEYNFPTVVSKNQATSSIRALDPSNPYHPCPSVPTQFRRACYFEQAAWWEQVYEEDYRTLGLLCEGVHDLLERRDCFRGIGDVAAASNRFRVEATISTCKAMPNKEAEVYCRAGASWGFFSEPKTREQASMLCGSLDEEGQRECTVLSQLIEEMIGKE